MLTRLNRTGQEEGLAPAVRFSAAAVEVSELRAYLGEHLPGYMIPSVFVELPALPLTANGKVDRKALPQPEQLEPVGEYVGPRTAVEEMLAGIWSEVLGVELVGIHDNFFELGGHSLLATQVISRVRKTYTVELPLRSLFETTTIARLAELIEEQKDQGSEAPASSVVPISREAYRTRNSLLRTDFT